METLSIDYNKARKKNVPSHMNQEKIIFIIQGLIKGGAENFFISLVNNLKDHGLQPVVIILSDYNPMLNEIDPAIKVYVLSRKFRYDLLISQRIKKIILLEKAKKVFCIGAFTFFLSKISLMHYTGYTFYLSLHTTVPVSMKEHLFDILYLKLLSSEDETIFICHSQQEYYRHNYFFNPSKSAVIYNGIDTEFSALKRSGDGDLIRKELDIPAGANVILKVANFRPEKGHAYAIDALQILHENYGNKAHLLFVGGGAEADFTKLQDTINRSAVSNYIHLIGPKNDVKPYLAAANIFTLTSYSVETFSIAALEAMSFGLPCCLTEIGGASEMVEPHKTGLLCTAKDTQSIANAWHELLTTPYDRGYIQQKVRTKFSSGKMIADYLSVFQARSRAMSW